jgi:outer membrane protein insertion porin family
MKVRNIIIEGTRNSRHRRSRAVFSRRVPLPDTRGRQAVVVPQGQKYTPERWKGTDKEKLIEKYYELGFRDAAIIEDTVEQRTPSTSYILLRWTSVRNTTIRNLHWVGNTVYNSDFLTAKLGMMPVMCTTRSS